MITKTDFDTILIAVAIAEARRSQEDELRIILRILLSNTSLEIKIKGAKTTPFISNIGSPPQGDGISGPVFQYLPFTIYFENYLKEVRQQIENEINIKWIEQRNSCLRKEMIYAVDSDFLTEDLRTKTAIEKIAPPPLEAIFLSTKLKQNTRC